MVYWFPLNNKTCYLRMFLAMLMAAQGGEGSMCVVSKCRCLEIFIYIPFVPHQHYNLLFYPCSSSLLTFPLSPLLSHNLFLLPFVLLFSPSTPYFTYSLSFPPPLFSLLPLIRFTSASSPLPSSSAPFFFVSNATRSLVRISHCVWLAHPVSSRFQHLQEMSREL